MPKFGTGERYDLRDFRYDGVKTYEEALNIAEQIDALTLSLSCCFHDDKPLGDRAVWEPTADACTATSKMVAALEAKVKGQ